MPHRVVFCQLFTKSKGVRDELIQKLDYAGRHAEQNEPGTLRYACLVPVDESDETTLYVVEEYTGDEAFNTHMALPHIADMLKWLGSGTVLEGDAKVKMNLTYVEDFFFTRPELKDAKDPFVLVAEIEYKPDAIPGTMPYWKAVFEEVRSSEPGTLTYAIASDKDAGNENTLYAIEAYESKDYLWNVHAKGTALQSSMTDTKHLRNDVKHNFLKVAGGFLTKG